MKSCSKRESKRTYGELVWKDIEVQWKFDKKIDIGRDYCEAILKETLIFNNFIVMLRAAWREFSLHFVSLKRNLAH